MRWRLTSLAATVGGLLASGCFPPGDGREPPLDRVYFPVGLEVSPAQSRLYMVNSDFDLQFNAGSLQVYDLPRLRQAVQNNHPDDDCGVLGVKSDASRTLSPGKCAPLSPTSPPGGGGSLILESVGIGAFATDVIFRPAPPLECDPDQSEDGCAGATSCEPILGDPGRQRCSIERPGGRLFIPVRGDATLHWVDVDDDSKATSTGFELDCGQGGKSNQCDNDHRRGDNPESESTRDLRMSPEPFGIDATEDGEAVVVTHQSDGEASLFVNHDWVQGGSSVGVGPKLEFITGGLPSGAVGVAAVPVPRLVREDPSVDYQPGFLVSFRNSASLELLRYYDDEKSSPQRPFLQRSGSVRVGANSLNFDSRGIAIDPSERRVCEAGCIDGAGSDEEKLECLRECAGIQLEVFVSNRTPASLLVGRTRPNNSATSSNDLPRFYDSLVLSFGASRVERGNVIDIDGNPSPRIFVVCFDSRRVYIVNPLSGAVETSIFTGRGPHALATDVDMEGASYAYAYLAHFTDSYLGVIDLDQRNRTYGTILATVATPTAPRASK